MSQYDAPLADIRFVLFDLLGGEALFARLGHADASRELLDAVLEEGARFTRSVLAPLNAVGDRHGDRIVTTVVAGDTADGKSLSVPHHCW